MSLTLSLFTVIVNVTVNVIVFIIIIITPLNFIPEKNAVEELKASVLDKTVQGALLDSYVAGYWAKIDPSKVLKDSSLRVGTVLDHQFAYGFVIAGALENDATQKCMRKKLNSMETEITTIIQEKAQTMEVEKSQRISVTLNLIKTTVFPDATGLRR